MYVNVFMVLVTLLLAIHLSAFVLARKSDSNFWAKLSAGTMVFGFPTILLAGMGIAIAEQNWYALAGTMFGYSVFTLGILMIYKRRI